MLLAGYDEYNKMLAHRTCCAGFHFGVEVGVLMLYCTLAAGLMAFLGDETVPTRAEVDSLAAYVREGG